MKNKILQFGIVVMFIIMNSILINSTTYATDYDTQNITLEIGVNDYAYIDNDCSGAMVLLNPNAPFTGTNLKAGVGRRYGTDTCRINFGYNDPTHNYAIKFGKTQDELISKSGGKIFKDIENPTDTTIDILGNTDEEEFGFNISNITGGFGTTQIDPDTSLKYNNSAAFFNIQFSPLDTIISSVATGLCAYGACYFDLNLHANMSIYEMDHDYTKFGVFDMFNCTTPPCADHYTVQVTLITPNP